MYDSSLKIGSRHVGAFWFLQYLAAVYLLYPAVRTVHDAGGSSFRWLLAVLFAAVPASQSVVRVALVLSSLCPCLAFMPQVVTFLSTFLPQVSAPLFFFVLGFALRDRYDAREGFGRRGCGLGTWLACWLASFGWAYMSSHVLGVTYDPSFAYVSIVTPVAVVGLLELCMLLPEGPVGKIATAVGSRTMGIYVLHPMLIFVLSAATGGRTWGLPFAGRLLVAVAVVAMGTFLTMLMERARLDGPLLSPVSWLRRRRAAVACRTQR